MTVVTTPVWIQAGGENAAQARRAFQSILGNKGGLSKPTDLEVTEHSTADMSVDVAAGSVWIPGTEQTDQGTYFAENDATVNLTIAAADETNDRIDLVVMQILDSNYSGTDDKAELAVVTGIAAASPVAPDKPDSSWVLAEISVSAAAASITSADITDKRTTWTGQAPRTLQIDDISTNEGTTSTTYTDLTTPGPEVTVHLEEGQSALVYLSCRNWNSTGGKFAFMGFVVSGASTQSESDSDAIIQKVVLNEEPTMSRLCLFTATAAGSHVFTCKYKSESSTVNQQFNTRRIMVYPLPLVV